MESGFAGVMWLFMLVYTAAIVAAAVAIVLALWRAMRAHEEIARNLGEIQRVLARERGAD